MDRRTEEYLNRLDASLQRLETQLHAYSSEELNRRPMPDQWSVMQVVNHLMMAETGSLNYLRKKLSTPSPMKKAGISAAFRTWFLNLSLSITFIKYKAPASVSEDKLPVVSDRDTVLQQWKTTRQELRSFLNTLPADLFDKEAYRHPRAGRMTMQQMLSFLETHFNRHLNQINRALSR